MSHIAEIFQDTEAGGNSQLAFENVSMRNGADRRMPGFERSDRSCFNNN